MVKQNIDIRPTKWGKLTTTFQMVSATLVLMQLNLAVFFWWLAVIFTLISGADYLRRGFKTLYAVDSNRNNQSDKEN